MLHREKSKETDGSSTDRGDPAPSCPQVTYRVVQVSDEHIEATTDGSGAVSVVSAAAFAGAPQAVAQVCTPPLTVVFFCGVHDPRVVSLDASRITLGGGLDF